MFINKLRLVSIEKSEIPAEYKKLLNHYKSMTVKLEEFYGQKMKIKVMKDNILDNTYEREIAMFGDDCIFRELAYIKIFINNLPDKDIYDEIIKKRKPFGKILIDHKIKVKREIEKFFKIYKKNNADYLYGRKYSIFLLPQKKILANIIEILL